MLSSSLLNIDNQRTTMIRFPLFVSGKCKTYVKRQNQERKKLPPCPTFPLASCMLVMNDSLDQKFHFFGPENDDIGSRNEGNKRSMTMPKCIKKGRIMGWGIGNIGNMQGIIQTLRDGTPDL
jgi:hypothetical protein